ncbi:MAG: hypothetical protein IT580_11300 [Verrucomicrobiales bacterium]|nr:hypothetical protein [Verrucomicrobiales bacterium]
MTSAFLRIGLVALSLLLPAPLRAESATLALDLAGTWRVRLDPKDEGVSARWFATPHVSMGTDTIPLPGTTDIAGLGFALDTNTMLHATPFPTTTRFPGVQDPSRADEHGYLVRRHMFVGPAWYERQIEIPDSWRDQRLTLHLERVLWQSEAWVDGRSVGTRDSLVAAHRHELGTLTPGQHRLTLRIDNRMIHNLSTITHAYGPETQTRWNGVVGSLRLEASPQVALRNLTAFPSADRRSVRVAIGFTNAISNMVERQLSLQLLPETQNTELARHTQNLTVSPGSATREYVLPLDTPATPWDEFQPVRYRLQATLDDPSTTAARSELTATVGFRQVERVGQSLRINGRTVFLRGTLDCAVYPRTGHPPMTQPEWERVLGTIKEHGFNHVRFHTWCPPEAAFEAADRIGLYLQAEAPAWVDDWGTSTVTRPLGIGRDPQVTRFLRSELVRMSEDYGHHPSFLLCAVGNEFGMQHTDWDLVNEMVTEIKTRDPRRLYAGCGARRNLAADDFWFTHQSGAGTRGVGPAHTAWDFAKAAATSPVPLIAHETGQRPAFPDFERLLPKFTGPLLPLNLVRFQRQLVAHHLDFRAADFARASARFQLVQYKAEHEAMLRTRGYSGYQLLMLNDFTGQSEALVGLLDPFWESKGIVTPTEVRAWNSPTVALARFPKYVWFTHETFETTLEVAHFGPLDLPLHSARWELRRHPDQALLGQGTTPPRTLPTGGVTVLDTLRVPLSHAAAPAALTLRVEVAGAENEWTLWVYPATQPDLDSEAFATSNALHLTTRLDETAQRRLQEGGKVLLLAHGVTNAWCATTGFESVYWSAGWWGNRFSSLGVLCDPQHPAFSLFPNAGHSDWQWRDLCAGATTFDLSPSPTEIHPLVQPVPDFHFSRPLAHVFEARVGRGSLMVCGYDLVRDLEKRPAARQFRRSLLRYLASPDFQPRTELPWSWVVERCGESAEHSGSIHR